MVCRRGWCTVHDEWLVHSSGGNSSDRFSDQINWFNRKGNLKKHCKLWNHFYVKRWRHTYVVAFRHRDMVAYERERGFRHSYRNVFFLFYRNVFSFRNFFLLQECFFPTAMFFLPTGMFFLYECFFFLQESFSYIFLFSISLIVFWDVVGNALNLFKNNSDNNTTTSTNYLV